MQSHYQLTKITVDLGDGVLSEAKRITDKITIRMKSDLYVELSQQEAAKALQELVALYRAKLEAANREIVKITASMREVEQLIQQYEAAV